MRSFGDLEAAIMDRIWSAGRPMLVRDVQQALTPERAYNAVLTVVDILYRKGRHSLPQGLAGPGEGRPGLPVPGRGHPGGLHRWPDA